MKTLEIPIKIQDDPYTRQEQFRELAPDFEIGNQGTVRFQNYSFRDGQAVSLGINGLEISRDAGFQQPLRIKKGGAESRVYYFRGCQWFQQTSTSETSLNSLQQKVGQFGFWIGIQEWLLDVIEIMSGIIGWLLAPILVVPRILIYLLELSIGIFFTVAICLEGLSKPLCDVN